jgi:uncharacterized protein with NRDE domain
MLSEKKIPKKYLTKDAAAMKREIKKHAKKDDDDASAYGPWEADYDKKGKSYKTKESKATKKYKEMYGEASNNFIDTIKSIIREELKKWKKH